MLASPFTRLPSEFSGVHDKKAGLALVEMVKAYNYETPVRVPMQRDRRELLEEKRDQSEIGA